MEILVVAMWALFGWLAYTMAEKRGRNPVGWCIAGVLFGIFAIIILALVGDTTEKIIKKSKQSQ